MKISPKNTKLGSIPNVSLTPVKACGNCAHCKNDCYALKSYRQYKNVRNSWDGNFEQAKTDLSGYMTDLYVYLDKKRPRLFRWHVSGDILSHEYLVCMFSIAKSFPETKFLAFTKMFNLDYSECPKNLSIVFSMWPGQPVPKNTSGVAGFYWLQDGSETRIPENAIECFGTCDCCGMCWNLRNMEVNHIFNHKH